MRDLAFYVEGVAEGRRGVLVQRQKDRSVWRVEEDGKVWFAKRGLTPKRRREIRREAVNARALEEAEFGPRVLASGEHSDAEWIVTEDAGSPFPYVVCMRDLRRSALHAVGEWIRRFHDAGFATPDLTAEHVCGSDGRVLLIDPARLECSDRPAARRSRARDLGALLFSSRVAVDGLSRVERVRLLREATGLAGVALLDLCAAVDREIDKRSRRLRWRHGHTEMSSDYAISWEAVTGWDDDAPPPPEDTASYRAWFFDEFIGREGMEIVRTLPDRENRRMPNVADDSFFFVKVFPPTKTGWSPAMRELAAIDLFQRAGILVNRVAAYAEDVDKGSMVAVKACDGEPLDDLLRRGVTVAERRNLAIQTARIWRRMRECGLRHRDAYPCHVFASLNAGGAQLRLIDMTRAGRAPFPRERWFVKDAAQLWHGCPKPPVTRTDAVRWLREYFRIAKLDARAKRFARRVAAKEGRIAARQARKRRA